MRKISLIICFLLLTLNLFAQKIITIDEVNEIVLKKSNKIKIINNNFSKANIEYSFYKISLLPKVSSSISFPYQRSISEVIQSDGSQKFIERNYLNSTLNLTLSQLLPFTGGSLSLTSSLNNIRDFNNKTSNFSSNWVNISYQQTVNGFNSFKWNKKLNTLNIKKDSISFLKEKIKLKYEVSKLYLDTQLLQLKTVLIEESIKKTEKILFELEEKLKFGRTIKIEVEQAKISLEQLKRQLEITKLEYSSGIQSLKNMMNDKTADSLILKSIAQEDYIVDKEILITSVLENEFDLEKTIRLLESESNMDKVKKEGAVSVNLQLGMGLNSSANNFISLYDIPSQSQFITFGTKIPILDWGKAKKNYALAKLEKDNIELLLKDDEMKIKEQVEELSNYKLALSSQKKSLQEQLKLSNNITEMIEELLKLGRKTIADYKTQLVESYNITIEYQKTINNLYLLKLKLNEINLIF